MSNISATNLSIAGTCAIAGTVSLTQPLTSSSTLNVQGITTSSLTTTGVVVYNVLPTSATVPTLPNQFITKSYCDTQNATQDVLINSLVASGQSLNTLTATQGTSINSLNTLTATQGTSISNIEALNVSQGTSISNIEALNVSQGTSISNIEALNVSQGNSINNLNTITSSQGTSISNIEALNVSQGNSINNLNTITSSQGTSISNIEALNISQGNSINNLNTRVNTTETKLTAVEYTTPVAGPLTTLTSSLNLLPYVANTFLKVYNINCQAITSLGQGIFGGLGIITSRLQMGYGGTIMTGMYFSNHISVVGNNVVNFPVSTFTGFIIPRVLISPSGNGVFYVVSRTLTSFTYSASVSGINVDFLVLQDN